MSHSTCPNCKAPIPLDAPGGICPACVLLGAAAPTRLITSPGVPALDEVRAAFPELEVLDVLGQGGMGVVFKARQPKLDRLIALKILPPALAAQPGFIERFEREARALAKLSHPHIVAVFDFGERAGFCYLAMEFVDGVNLRAAIRAGVKPEQALGLVPRICEALQFAHDHGVLHRDIKPENILLDVRGVPKLADFGIAKLAGDPTHAGLTLSGAQLGTAAYMAPEQVEKPATVDHRADIYSLGVVLYEMLTGELPLGRFAAPSEKSNVGSGVDDVVLRALEKERERRQQSAREMKTQVEHASAGGAGFAPRRAPAAIADRGQPWSRAAVWGFALSLLSVPLGYLLFAIVRAAVRPALESGSQLNGPVLGNVVIFGFVFAVAGMGLGWKAVSDMRHHRGHLRGGGCAVVSALFLPVVALLLAVVANFKEIATAAEGMMGQARGTREGTVAAIFCLLAAIAASIWAIRALWRFVHDGPPGVPPPVRGVARVEVREGAAGGGDGAWSTVFRLNALFCALLLPVSALAPWKVPSVMHMLGGVVLFALLYVFAKAGERERPAFKPGERARGFRIAAQFAVVFVILAFSLPPLAVKVLESSAREERAAVDGRLVAATAEYERAERDLRDVTHEEAPDAAARAARDARLEGGKRRFAAADDALQRARVAQRQAYARYPDGDRHGIGAALGLVCAVLALSYGMVAWLRRPGAAVQVGNPWPRRIFWLIVVIFVLPVVIIIVGLVVPALTIVRQEVSQVVQAGQGIPGGVSLEDEAVALARQALGEAERRVAAGIAQGMEVANAQFQLATAEARGDAVKIAEARIRFLEEQLKTSRAEFEAGTLAADSVRQIEYQLNVAKQELEKARAAALFIER